MKSVSLSSSKFKNKPIRVLLQPEPLPDNSSFLFLAVALSLFLPRKALIGPLDLTRTATCTPATSFSSFFLVLLPLPPLLCFLLKRTLPVEFFLPHHGRQEAAAAGSRILELQREAGSEAGSLSRKKLRWDFFLLLNMESGK